MPIVMGAIEANRQVSPETSLIDTLSSSSYSFLHPPQSLHAATLASAKRYIDPIAVATSQLQGERQQILRKKRKRGQPDHYDARAVLRLKQLHLEGFSIEQIWEQARRTLDASRLEVERSLRSIHLVPEKSQSFPVTSHSSQKDLNAKKGKSVHFRVDDEPNNEIDSTDDEKSAASEYRENTDEEASNEAGNAELDDVEVDEEFVDEGVSTQNVIDDGDDDDDNENQFNEEYDEDADSFKSSDEGPSRIFVPDKNGLNDGFFSIDEFNRQAEFLEQRDAQGQDDGAASDEEDIDWDADPLAQGAASRLDGNADGVDNGESQDNEASPTFGNPDEISNGNDASDSDVEVEESGPLSNTNLIRYADFFEPPSRKAKKKNKSNQPVPKKLAPPRDKADEDADMQRTMAAVHRDIFEDDLTPDEDEAPSDPEGRRSSHQKRQAALTAEIRRLEAAAVQKRDWTLSGEARAADRPLNSLLEEDLEFERVGKPVPVITQEVSEDIEALIKRRILARDFDEVIRRRPENLATGGGKDGQGRGMFDLSDAKPEQSLAEIYETEHLQRTDPAGHPSKADQKLDAEHKRIEALWKDVSAKLDALCSWHYRPKPPSAEVTVVADVPTISMEDPRPAGVGGDVGAESMLAPQEIYKAGETRDKAKEVVTGGGLPVGRDEMTREEKLRRRRREKERIRKSGEGIGLKKGQRGGKKAEGQTDVVKDLERVGAGVIGKKGEIRDVRGNAIKSHQAGKGAGGYKL